MPSERIEPASSGGKSVFSNMTAVERDGPRGLISTVVGLVIRRKLHAQAPHEPCLQLVPRSNEIRCDISARQLKVEYANPELILISLEEKIASTKRMPSEGIELSFLSVLLVPPNVNQTTTLAHEGALDNLEFSEIGAQRSDHSESWCWYYSLRENIVVTHLRDEPRMGLDGPRTPEQRLNAALSAAPSPPGHSYRVKDFGPDSSAPSRGAAAVHIQGSHDLPKNGRRNRVPQK
ncbi:hypothetical protein C8J57DRAFT_1225927 [Mycena rebaudengoi]|nr:hypothetical protein C8J57DRAFT_1225927 [Mycena rebaudengoi]